ncbi:MAG: Trypsin-like protein [Solirubrobacterales bacterium]|nr:Trypsin-like protein [Solirubrobacterales bacterium]
MHRSRALLSAAVAALALTAPAAAQADGHTTRIVGGTDAPAGVYDAVANVNIAFAFGCTGTLITPEWVLSAGHCGSLTGATGFGTPIGWPPGAITATLGTRNADGSGGTRYTVDEVKLPTGYLAVDGYDISLLHLDTPATIAPIQVAGKGSESLWAPGVSELIVGFGTTSAGGSAPDILQEARVPIVTDEYCATKYSGFEAQTQICAGYPEGGIDTCQGDSGGPMFGRDATGALKVVGATSYGEGCADPDTPGVYARVGDTTLREWIRSVAGDAAIDDEPATTAGTGTTATEPPVTTTTEPPVPAPAPAMTTARPEPAPAAQDTGSPAAGQATAPAAQSAAGAPAATPGKACATRRVAVRLKARFAKRVRSAVVLLNGKRVGTLRTAEGGVPVSLVRAKRGPAVVKVVMTLRDGRKQTDTRRLACCTKA